MFNSTLSLTSALDGLVGQRRTSAALPPGKTSYPLYSGLWRTSPSVFSLRKLWTLDC